MRASMDACMHATVYAIHAHGCTALQADEELGKFMDYCTYGHMIDNVVLIVTGTLHERDVQVSLFAHTSPPSQHHSCTQSK